MILLLYYKFSPVNHQLIGVYDDREKIDRVVENLCRMGEQRHKFCHREVELNKVFPTFDVFHY